MAIPEPIAAAGRWDGQNGLRNSGPAPESGMGLAFLESTEPPDVKE